MVPASRQDCDRYQSLFTSHQSLRIPFPLAALEYTGPCTDAPAMSDCWMRICRPASGGFSRMPGPR